jgi:hypothetical protein
MLFGGLVGSRAGADSDDVRSWPKAADVVHRSKSAAIWSTPAAMPTSSGSSPWPHAVRLKSADTQMSWSTAAPVSINITTMTAIPTAPAYLAGANGERSAAGRFDDTKHQFPAVEQRYRQQVRQPDGGRHTSQRIKQQRNDRGGRRRWLDDGNDAAQGRRFYLAHEDLGCGTLNYKF